MKLREIETYLHTHIPISRAMALRVIEATEAAVVIEAGLTPNLNHRGTAFGGSVSALAILTGWTGVHFRLRSEGYETHTVIHESAVRYHVPIQGDFRATARRIDDDRWARFTKTLTRRGKARVRTDVVVEADGVEAASFTGSYVAIVR